MMCSGSSSKDLQSENAMCGETGVTEDSRAKNPPPETSQKQPSSGQPNEQDKPGDSTSGPEDFWIGSMSTTSEDGSRFLPKLLPISGSVLDLLCVVQRLASFAQTMCNTICPYDIQGQVKDKGTSVKVSEDGHDQRSSPDVSLKVAEPSRRFDSSCESGEGTGSSSAAQGQGQDGCQQPEVKVTETIPTEVNKKETMQRRTRSRVRVLEVIAKVSSFGCPSTAVVQGLATEVAKQTTSV